MMVPNLLTATGLLACLLPLSLTQSTTLTNPVIWQDHPDLDVFRVGNVFYYSSSTFAFSPGAPVLRSYDLANWEAVSHSVPTLNFGSSAFNLTSSTNRAYVKGIWASTLNYRPASDTFYWLGCIQGTGQTFVYSSPGRGAAQNAGEVSEWNWTQRPSINNCYYDAGLLIDNDSAQTMYVAYGNTEIRVAQLSLSGNGDLREARSQLVFTGSETIEGARMYKRGGYYYILVTRPADAEYVLRASSPWGPYTRRDLVVRIGGPLSQAGFAHQGGMVDTPDGRWYYVAFLDAYPGGRIPVVAPLTWSSDGWPSLVRDSAGAWGRQYPIPVSTTKTIGKPLVPVVEDFRAARLGHNWEWNHNPDDSKWSLDGQGLVLRTATVTGDLFSARNTLTHRTAGPKSSGTFRIDISRMQDGDRAGAVLFRDVAAYIGVHKTGNSATIVMVNNLNLAEGTWTTSSTGSVAATGPTVTSGEIWLRVTADITPAFGTNTARQTTFSYSTDGRTFTSLGPSFGMTNSWRFFTGYRFGVFNFATKALGGEVRVKGFEMQLV